MDPVLSQTLGAAIGAALSAALADHFEARSPPLFLGFLLLTFALAGRGLFLVLV